VQRPVLQPDPAARLAVGAELIQAEAEAGQCVQQEQHDVQLAHAGRDIDQLVQHRDQHQSRSEIDQGTVAEAPQFGEKEFDHEWSLSSGAARARMSM
jgi:hypothetical protein